MAAAKRRATRAVATEMPVETPPVSQLAQRRSHGDKAAARRRFSTTPARIVNVAGSGAWRPMQNLHRRRRIAVEGNFPRFVRTVGKRAA